MNTKTKENKQKKAVHIYRYTCLTYGKMSFELCDSVKFSKYAEKEYYNFKSY